jgi:hypothetical protein
LVTHYAVLSRGERATHRRVDGFAHQRAHVCAVVGNVGHAAVHGHLPPNFSPNGQLATDADAHIAAHAAAHPRANARTDASANLPLNAEFVGVAKREHSKTAHVTDRFAFPRADAGTDAAAYIDSVAASHA